MSIHTNNQPSNTRPNDAVRDADKPRDRTKDPRDQPKAEQVDKFRNLLQAKGEKLEKGLDPRLQQGREAGQMAQLEGQSGSDATPTATDLAITRDSDAGADTGSDTGGDSGNNFAQQGLDAMQPAELAALYQAQIVAREVPATPPAATPIAHANPQALADMLERHVRQLAISPSGTDPDKSRVLLRLNDATLPGTDLLLSRTETGWLLRADVRSRGTYEAIQQAAPQLAERFASRNLGVLEIEPQFHAW